MLLGMHLRDVFWHKQTAFQAMGFDRIDEVMDYVNNKYVDEVEKEKLMNETIHGLLQKLDPHSTYIAAEDAQEGYENMQGKFDGIGIEFQMIGDTATVVRMLKNSPAKQAGMSVGDKILWINTVQVAGKNLNADSLKFHLKGSRGTKVKVKALRINDTLQFNIARNTIQVASVPYAFKINDSTLYVKINEFTQQTFAEFRDSLQSIKTDSSNHIIIDLRDNPGGYLSEAINILDEIFEPKKLLLYTEGNHKQRKDYFSTRKGLYEKFKISVLVNESSASASEIIAGAIQDWDRGLIIGQETFGKGLVQEEYELSNGSVLRLTIARYFTPSGRCIQRDYSEGSEKYYENVEKRLVHDSVTKSLKDSSALFYTLLKKRPVKGKGGILPDIVVKQNFAAHVVNIDWYYKINEIVYSNYHVLTQYKKDIPSVRNFINQQLQIKFKANRNVLKSLETHVNDFATQISIGEKAFYQQKIKNDDNVKAALANHLP